MVGRELEGLSMKQKKDMTRDVLRALKASHSKKNFEPCLGAQI
jgi:hypothetical protein